MVILRVHWVFAYLLLIATPLE